jgi:hypothetical protein
VPELQDEHATDQMRLELERDPRKLPNGIGEIFSQPGRDSLKMTGEQAVKYDSS